MIDDERDRRTILTRWKIGIATFALTFIVADAWMKVSPPRQPRRSRQRCYNSLSFVGSFFSDEDEPNDDKFSGMERNGGLVPNKQQGDLEASLRELVRDKSVLLQRENSDNENNDNLSSITNLMEAYVSQREEDKIKDKGADDSTTKSSPQKPSLRYDPSSTDISKVFDDDDWDEDGQDSALPILDQDDGIFLDSERYLEGSYQIGQDGSLLDDEKGGPTASINRELYETIVQKLSEPPPNSPSAEQSTRHQQQQTPDADMQEFWQALQKKNLNQISPERLKQDAEELHRQVFAEEQGFLEQSKLFRQSLFNDNTTLATADRRKKRFDRKQEKARSILEAHLDEFEKEFLSQPPDEKDRPRCYQCHCLLSPQEISSSAGQTNDVRCQLCHADELLAETSRLERNRSRQYRTEFQSERQINSRSSQRGTFRPFVRRDSKSDIDTSSSSPRSQKPSSAHHPGRQRPMPPPSPPRDASKQTRSNSSRPRRVYKSKSRSSFRVARSDNEDKMAQQREEFRNKFLSFEPNVVRNERQTDDDKKALEKLLDPDSGEV